MALTRSQGKVLDFPKSEGPKSKKGIDWATQDEVKNKTVQALAKINKVEQAKRKNLSKIRVPKESQFGKERRRAKLHLAAHGLVLLCRRCVRVVHLVLGGAVAAGLGSCDIPDPQLGIPRLGDRRSDIACGTAEYTWQCVCDWLTSRYTVLPEMDCLGKHASKAGGGERLYC